MEKQETKDRIYEARRPSDMPIVPLTRLVGLAQLLAKVVPTSFEEAVKEGYRGTREDYRRMLSDYDPHLA